MSSTLTTYGSSTAAGATAAGATVAEAAHADRRAPLDQQSLRRAFGHFPSGLVAVAAQGPHGPVGLVASSFTSVSMDPPLVSVNIGLSSTTLPELRRYSSWGISVLADRQDGLADLLRRPSADRFAGIGWQATADGAVHLDEAAAGFTTEPVQWVPAGDHTIALLRVHDHFAADHETPLIFHRSGFRRLAQQR